MGFFVAVVGWVIGFGARDALPKPLIVWGPLILGLLVGWARSRRGPYTPPGPTACLDCGGTGWRLSPRGTGNTVGCDHQNRRESPRYY